MFFDWFTLFGALAAVALIYAVLKLGTKGGSER
jgi:hypothetical protein